MTPTRKELPDGFRDFLSSTIKLLLLVVVLALLCGYAYGWVVGAKVWGAFSIIVAAGQVWSCRKDIAAFVRDDQHPDA